MRLPIRHPARRVPEAAATVLTYGGKVDIHGQPHSGYLLVRRARLHVHVDQRSTIRFVQIFKVPGSTAADEWQENNQIEKKSGQIHRHSSLATVDKTSIFAWDFFHHSRANRSK
jgi:hypothetical protein